jgi:energy-coupling factor transporter ATP-binding protein EcfA2
MPPLWYNSRDAGQKTESGRMLKRLSLKNFTVFSSANFELSKGVNVVVGENGAGKSHFLKVAYTIAAVSGWGERDAGAAVPTKSYLESAIAKRLRGVFRPDALGRLARRQAGRNRCEVGAVFHASKTEVAVEPCPTQWEAKPPVFIPTRELLTIFPGFVSVYDTTDLSFEETWRDTCVLLGAPLAKGPRVSDIKPLLEPLEAQLDAKVVLDDGRFYLRTPSGNIEAHLVAEGLRKLAMIARLIATGSLVGTGSLFWDEPESNLNPKVIKKVALTILQLCRSGIQVFVATHSLFFLRELDLLLKTPEFDGLPARFFGLHPGDDGVRVQQGDTIDGIGQIDSLDEELSQSDRYMDAEGGET